MPLRFTNVDVQLPPVCADRIDGATQPNVKLSSSGLARNVEVDVLQKTREHAVLRQHCATPSDRQHEESAAPDDNDDSHVRVEHHGWCASPQRRLESWCAFHAADYGVNFRELCGIKNTGVSRLPVHD